MSTLHVTVLDKEQNVGAWLINQLSQIDVRAQWVASVAELLNAADAQPPAVCLVALRAPVTRVLNLITDLSQEPRFARTAFIMVGPLELKHAAFEAGADDYLITPPDVIELRKRVRLYLDRAELETRVREETHFSAAIDALARIESQALLGPMDAETRTLLEHAAALSRERDQLELIARNASQAIALVDLNGTTLYANPSWHRLVDHLPPENNPFAWPPTASDDATTEAIAEAVQNTWPWHGQLDWPQPESASRHVSLFLDPTRNAAGEVIGYVIMLHD